MCLIKALTKQWWLKYCPSCDMKVAGQCGQLELPRQVPAVCPYCGRMLAEVKRTGTVKTDRERVKGAQPSPQKVMDMCKNSRTPPGAR